MPESSHRPVEAATALSPADLEQVVALVRGAERADGTPPISEQALLRLRSAGGAPTEGVQHLLARAPGGEVVGYGNLTQDPNGGDGGDGEADGALVGELVVAPAHRGAGVGTALVGAALAARGDRPLRLWAHGDSPAARAVARAAGLVPVRELLTMRADLATSLPGPVPAPGEAPWEHLDVPEGVRVRTFSPGRDEDAWLAVNARAFADHPEQGSWTREDLLAREAEDWFDPAGFFLAEDEATGRLLGFHWTKVPPEARAAAADEERAGEVYVVGVDPAAQGRRLGALLTRVGLEHLRAAGLAVAELYVESDNAPALAVYRRMGFERSGADVVHATA